MSFGAGHIQDMNNRMKQNRAQRPSQRPKFKENNRETIYSDSETTNPIEFKKISPSQLLQFKKQILMQSAYERRKDFFLFMIALGLATIVFLFALKVL